MFRAFKICMLSFAFFAKKHFILINIVHTLVSELAIELKVNRKLPQSIQQTLVVQIIKQRVDIRDYFVVGSAIGDEISVQQKRSIIFRYFEYIDEYIAVSKIGPFVRFAAYFAIFKDQQIIVSLAAQ